MKPRIRYLTTRPGPHRRPRYFWQPSTALRGAGWRLVRLPDDLAAAIAAAEQLNQQVDAWRQGAAGPRNVKPAKRQAKALAAGSVAALRRDYEGSRFWAHLAPATQSSYRRHLDAIEAWAGDAPAGAITPPLVEKFYQQQRGARGDAAAAAAVRVLRVLLQAGVRLGYVAHNAAARPGLEVTKQRTSRLWSDADVAAMVAAADRLGWRSLGTAVLLNDWLGQRLQDVLALPRWDVADGWLAFRQGKRGRDVALPLGLVPHLVARLHQESERPGAVAHASHLLVNDRTGQPWKVDAFKHAFMDVRAAAAEDRPEVAGLWFMELRHTAVTRLHEAGLDALTIAGLTGHAPVDLHPQLVGT
ncbi:MAG: tyrosine-type recombinase/integrase, partial [Roseicyclus sp.]